MNILAIIRAAFSQKYADFNGKAGRKELLACHLIFYALLIFCLSADSFFFFALIFLVLLTPVSAVAARRLHDAGLSKKLVWFFIAPVVYFSISLLLIFIFERTFPHGLLGTLFFTGLAAALIMVGSSTILSCLPSHSREEVRSGAPVEALQSVVSAWKNSAIKQRILASPFIINSLETIRNLALRYGLTTKAQEENTRLTKRGYAVIGGGCLLFIFLFASIFDYGDSEITDFHSRPKRGYVHLADMTFGGVQNRYYVETIYGNVLRDGMRVRHGGYYFNHFPSERLAQQCAARNCSRSSLTYYEFHCDTNSVRLLWLTSYSGYHLSGRVTLDYNRADPISSLNNQTPATRAVFQHVCRY